MHERELEVQAAEARLHRLDHSLCPHCDYPIERDFVRCPSCLRKLKERCASCAKPLDRAWSICPYCETEVPAAAPPRRRTRRRSPAADGEVAVAISEPPAPSRPEIGKRTSRGRAAREASEEAPGATDDGRTAGAAPEPASHRPEIGQRTPGRSSRPRPTS